MRIVRLLAIASLVAVPAVLHAEHQGQKFNDAPEKVADSEDKIVCKHFPVTGSLVDSYRVCKPKREWEHERTNINGLGVANSCQKWAEGGQC
jgi:hypothetical protein